MTTIRVTTLDDVVGDDGVLSLREAVAAANAATGADTIDFDPSLAGGVVHLASAGQLTVSDALAIAGGPSGITIDANADGDNNASTHLGTGNRRALDIGEVTVTLSDLTVTGGHTVGDAGGGIRTEGDLTLERSLVRGNGTSGEEAGGGGIAQVSGGLFATPGSVTLVDSTVAGNSTAGAMSFGGGVYADDAITVEDSTISGNATTGSLAQGGGLYSPGSIAIVGSTVSGNSTAGGSASGGGAFAFSMALTNSTVSGNHTAAIGTPGGGLATVGNLTLVSSTVTGNWASGISNGGGGVYLAGMFDVQPTLTVANSIVLGNLAADPIPGNTVADEVLIGSNGTLSRSASLLGDGTFDASKVFGATSTLNIQTLVGPRSVLVGVLADNGGPTQTVALLAGGLAANAGDADRLPAGLDTDQRGSGFARISGDGLDIGSFELQHVAAAPDRAATQLRASVAIDVISNDEGAGRPALVEGPASGLALLIDGDRFLYLADRGFAGADSFTYEADNGETSDRARVSVAVEEWPVAPIMGTAKADLLFATAASDAVRGLAGDDELRGGPEDDLLEGGRGDDLLAGGRGDDSLFGSLGRDTLVGGRGADEFVLTGHGTEQIRWFDAASGDRIVIAAASLLLPDGSVDGARLDLVATGAGAVLRADLDGDGTIDDRLAAIGHIGDLSLDEMLLNAIGYDLG